MLHAPSTLPSRLVPGLVLMLVPVLVLGPALCGHPAAGGEASQAPPAPASRSHLVFVGTYTGRGSEGIYAFPFQAAGGQAGRVELAAKTENPSFLALHPGGKFLYAVNEVGRFRGEATGAVSAFAIEEGGKLRPLNQEPSGGVGPCHLVLDRSGRQVVVANYGGGTVAALAVGQDGRLASGASVISHRGSSIDRRRQEGPHAHCVNLDPRERFLLACDLGLDKVLVHRFRAEGPRVLEESHAASLRPGAGPRHLAFHPGGRFAYVINELDCTVTAFSYEEDGGALKEIQTASTLPVDRQPGFSTAEVEVHPSGRFLYGSNRGHDSIAVFGIDQGGKLTPLEHVPTRGKTPRSFGLDPSGAWLLAANQGSDTIAVFRIDPGTGRLTAAGEPLAVPSPVCVKFLPQPGPAGSPTRGG